MPIYNTYIQQLSFDGTTYTKGAFLDLYRDYHIVAQDFPFAKNPESKDLAYRDWAGEDGLDVYIPTSLPVKEYPIEVTFLYKGNDSSMRSDITGFIDFLYGRNVGAIGSRLAIYNEHVGMGRKDIVVSNVSNELFYLSEFDPDAIAAFKIKFNVYDPTSEVGVMTQMMGGEERVIALTLEGTDF